MALQRIGIFGGSFDPVHHGHLAIVQAGQAALNLDQVILIPTAQQPLKPAGAYANGDQRLAMLRLACDGVPGLVVSSIELTRGQPSYTIDTVQALTATHQAEWFLIIGADAARLLPHWKAFEQLPLFATIVVMQRPQTSVSIHELEAYHPHFVDRIIVVDGPQLSISSSEIRQRVATSQSIRGLTPDSVVDYIQTHRLYR